jgi:hypothetical protein
VVWILQARAACSAARTHAARRRQLSRRSLQLTRFASYPSLISDAYFQKGFAWYDIGRLQLEQMATLGHAESASMVAERMSVVFQVLLRAAHCSTRAADAHADRLRRR